MGCLYPFAVDPTIFVLKMGIAIFLIVWIIFVPIVMSARLDRIVKLLEKQNKG